jgi:hypothetical protein
MAKNSSTANGRSRRGTVTSLPKNKRKTSRRSTLPAVPPISVLIVEGAFPPLFFLFSLSRVLHILILSLFLADNPINQTILSVFMRKKGISYKVAKDGEQAVQMWKKGNFHLVLVRLLLPLFLSSQD